MFFLRSSGAVIQSGLLLQMAQESAHAPRMNLSTFTPVCAESQLYEFAGLESVEFS